jgi:hypothetical protein
MSERDARALEDLIFDMRDLIETARMMPMSASVLVNRDEALSIVEDTLQTLPEELRRARWLLKERDEFLEQAKRDADAIVDAARLQAERMVERTEIAREARRTAEQVVLDAEGSRTPGLRGPRVRPGRPVGARRRCFRAAHAARSRR